MLLLSLVYVCNCNIQIYVPQSNTCNSDYEEVIEEEKNGKVNEFKNERKNVASKCYNR